MAAALMAAPRLALAQPYEETHGPVEEARYVANLHWPRMGDAVLLTGNFGSACKRKPPNRYLWVSVAGAGELKVPPFTSHSMMFRAPRSNPKMQSIIQNYSNEGCCEEKGWIYVLTQPNKRLTPDEIDAYARSANSADGYGTLIGAAGLVCVLTGGAGCVVYEAGAVVAGGLGWWFQKLANDPIDPNYTVIAAPVYGNAPALKQGGGVTRDVAAAVNAWQGNSERVTALMQAMFTALNRSQGAVAAADAYWETQQMQAAAAYAAEASALVADQPNLRAALSSAMRASGFPVITLAASDVDAWQDDLWTNGFTDDQWARAVALHASGYSYDARRYVLEGRLATVSAADVVALGTTFPDILTSPEWAARDAEVTASLAQFATRNGVALLDPRTPYPPTFENVKATDLTVVWMAPTPDASTYTIERSPTAAGPWTVVASDVTGLSLADSGLQPNTTYHYRVRAVDSAGPTDWSRPGSVKTLVPPPSGAPGAPTFPFRGPAGLTVQWTAAPDAASYRVERADDESGAPGPWLLVAPPTGETMEFDSGLDPSTRYWYRVCGTNEDSKGPCSEPRSVLTTPAAPGAPTFTDVGPHTVTLSWSAPAGGAAAYIVHRATSAYGSYARIATNVAGTSYVDATVAANVTYWYRISATNAEGWEGPSSAESFVWTLIDPAVPVPGAPGAATYSSVSTSYLNVKWSAAADAVSYKLERAPDASGAPGAWAEITSAVTGLSYWDSGLVVNGAYWYRVRATNAGGDGPYSVPSKAVTLPDVPGTPTFSDVGPNTVTVRWSAPNGGAATYEIARATSAAGPWTEVATGVGALVYVDPGVGAFSTYFYRVRGTNSAGLDGAYSPAASVSIPVAPPGAAGTPTYSSIATTSLIVNWSAAVSAASYSIERAPDVSGAPGGWTQIAGAVAVLTYADTGRTANATYWYRVLATNEAGVGPYSAESSVTTLPNAPGAPTFSETGQQTVTVSWVAPAGGAATYKVERGASSTGPWTEIAGSVASPSHVDTTVAPGTTYWYRVRATNATGLDGSYSPARSVLTQPAASTAPTYTSVGATSLTVNWTAVAGAASYKVERAPDASGAPGTWAQIAGSVTTLTYTDSGRAANTTYWYRVRATNAAGEGPNSEPSSIMTAPNAPGAPTFTEIGPSAVTVNWTVPAGGAATYKVERGTSSTGPWTEIAQGVVAATHVDATVTRDVTYWYRVRATNSASLDGNYSPSASVTPVEVPAAPGAPAYGSVSASSLILSWSAAAGAASYQLERAPDSSGAPGTWTQIASGLTAPTYTDSGRTANTAYWYRVRGTNAAGDGPYSDASSAVTAPNAPGAPTFTELGPYTVTLSWTAPAGGAASYAVERGTSASGPWAQIATGVLAPSYTDAAVTPDVTYWYQVRAANAVGITGTYSPTTSVTPVHLPAAPGTPAYAAVTTSAFQVSWTAAPGAVSYKLERAADVSGGPGAWSQVTSGATSLTYTDAGHPPNTAHWFRVRATNAAGDGPYSGASPVMTLPNAPSAPAFSEVGGHTVTVSWAAPTGGAATYTLERGASATGPWTQIATGVTVPTFVDSGVVGPATYFYRVRARNALGLDGAYSAAASVVLPDPTVAVPGAPGTATYSYVYATSLRVNWTAGVDAVSYKVERAADVSGSPGAWTQIASAVTGLTYLDSGRTANTAYWYRARATNAGGDGPYSSPSMIATLANAPGVPTFADVGSYTVTIAWAAPAGGAVSYKVERGVTSSGPWTQIVAGLSSPSHVDATVAANVTYWYRVRATNAVALDSSYSPSASVTTPVDPATTLPVAPGPATYTTIATTYLYVNWTAPEGAVSYKVERAPDVSGAPGTWTQIASAVTALSYRDSTLSANGAYWYRVRATNGAGDGPYSGPTLAMTLPNAPGVPALSDVGPYTVTASWTAPAGGAASYKVERGTSSTGPWTQVASAVTATSYVDTSVAPNVTYWYRVRATNAVGLNGAYSATASVSTPIDPAMNLPAAPGTPSYTSVATTSLYVNWSAATGAVSYKVERAPDVSGAPGTWTQIASAVTALSYRDATLVANTAYWYRVRATNAAGDGPYSTESKAMTVPNAPSAPTFSGVEAHSVTVAWTAPAGGAASYKLERGTASNGPWTQVASGVATPSYIDATVAANVTYWYRVRATNATGLDGASSSGASVSTPIDPGMNLPSAPGTPTYSSVNVSYQYVSWTAATDAVSYKLERAPDVSGAPGAWAQVATGVTALTYLNSGLAANTAYWYRVRATNAAGDGPYSTASKAMTAPNAPGAPSFSDVGSYSVTVSWAAPTGGAASYKVERGTSSTGPWTQVASGVVTSSHVDATVAANVTYWYRVRATNAIGINGSYSATASVSTPVDPGVALPGAPGTPTYSSPSTTYHYVNWTAATGAVSYKIERAPDVSGAPGVWTQLAGGVTALSYFNSGLTANTAYWYRVRATNAAGDGPYSTESKGMTLPTAPGAPTFSAVGPSTVTVTWTPPTSGAASYKVERGTSSIGPWTQVASGVVGTSYTDATVAANVTYWYRVRATNASGLDGGYSPTASVPIPLAWLGPAPGSGGGARVVARILTPDRWLAPMARRRMLT